MSQKPDLCALCNPKYQNYREVWLRIERGDLLITQAMAAYADAISLLNTLRRLARSSCISIAPSFQFLRFVVNELVSLEDVIRRLDEDFGDRLFSKRMLAVHGQASEAVRKLEDTLDSIISNQIILSQSHDDQETSLEADHEAGFALIFSPEDLEQLRREIHPVTELVREMEEYFEELTSNALLEGEEEDDDDGSSEIVHIGGNKPKMVGFSGELELLQYFTVSKLRLPTPDLVSRAQFVTLSGMAGVGKTTLAREIFEHPSTQFDCRAWVTVGQKCSWRRILQHILAQVDPGNRKNMNKVGEKELEGCLTESLKERDYLIVLDDVWDEEIFDGLRKCLPEKKDPVLVLSTTRLKITRAQGWNLNYLIQPRDKEESWDILREKVFGEERCPFQLEEVGRKIAENCEGLPLLIVEVAKLLVEADKTPEYWDEVAEKRNLVFIDAHDQILEVLFPSYFHLDTIFKAPFVYMGVFPQKYKIRRSEIMKLWCAEGMVQQLASEDFAVNCLNHLFERTLIITNIRKSKNKTCSLHSVFWHLCYRVAGIYNFFHVLEKRADSLTEGIKGQRRLCIHNNVLFGIKDVHDSMSYITTARSLLCTGPYHQYPVPLYFNFRMLKVLYALTIRFYEFPKEVVKLVLLRYLALTYDGKIPSFISKLWNLEFFIVHQHFNIKSSGDRSYLPMEIWEMKELKYLQIMGINLPNPCGALLPNLLTLSGVSAESCTKCVFEGLPNLKKLGVRIELAPDATEPLGCFDHISHLNNLESLKCVIGSPNVKSPQAPMKMFPPGLKILSLSGFGYPWEDMRVIASLPNLEMLKLRSYAFRGPKWEMRDEGLLGLQSHLTKDTKDYDYTFNQLKFLKIEDTDLVHWRITRGSFPSLESLVIKHCYKLKEIPLELDIRKLKLIRLVDCNPAALTCAKQIEKAIQRTGNYYFSVSVHSSWV